VPAVCNVSGSMLLTCTISIGLMTKCVLSAGSAEEYVLNLLQGTYRGDRGSYG